MPKIMPVYGTRPEGIKMAPLIRSLTEISCFDVLTTVTGQHREMLDQVNEFFGILPEFDLDVFQQGQTLDAIVSRTLSALGPILNGERPDAVIVQGDTSSALAAALAAFHARVPVVHLEAGLRSHNRFSPFPEEANRKLISHLTTLHLAPTKCSKANLLAESIEPSAIAVTGNTVIDALQFAVDKAMRYIDSDLQRLDECTGPVLLVTMHRRENQGPAMQEVGMALAEVAKMFPDLITVLPVHKNPVVRRHILPSIKRLPNVIVTEPLQYSDFARLLGRAFIVLTDSGGVQEEAPSLGKPVLVLRENTERPEAVEAGTVKLVGTSSERVVTEICKLLSDTSEYERMARAVNPYGDGKATGRCVAALLNLLRGSERSPDFTAEADDVA